MGTKLGRMLMGLLLVIFVGCTKNPQPRVPVTSQMSPDQLREIIDRQDETDQRVLAVAKTAESGLREVRGLRETVMPQLANHETQLQEQGTQIADIRTWQEQIIKEAMEMRSGLKKQGKAQGKMRETLRKGSLLHGWSNVEIWTLAWKGGTLDSESQQKLVKLRGGLQDGQQLVSIVAFCDRKAKCDNSAQKAESVASRIGVPGVSFIERQTGHEDTTVVLTARRNK